MPFRKWNSFPSVAVAVLLALVALPARPVSAAKAQPAPGAQASQAEGTSATVLLYHRLEDTADNEMTIRISVFESQMKFLHDNGYNVVPLRNVVNFIQGKGQLPPRAVAITCDDGHESVYTVMKPVMERYGFPVTLFIYPSAISNAHYAMTWQQLAELKAGGLFDIESHTYWHPNFHVEKRHLSAPEYQKLVQVQLDKSRKILQQKFGTQFDLLAWPFGIYDDDLIASARAAGYTAAFTIARRKATREDSLMTIPRYIVTDGDVGKAFEELLNPKQVARSSGGAPNRPGR